MSPSNESNWTSNWPTSHVTMSHNSQIDTHPTYRHQEAQANPQTNMTEQQISSTLLTSTSQWLNFYGVKQKLTHSSQCLHQQIKKKHHTISLNLPQFKKIYILFMTSLCLKLNTHNHSMNG